MSSSFTWMKQPTTATDTSAEESNELVHQTDLTDEKLDTMTSELDRVDQSTLENSHLSLLKQNGLHLVENGKVEKAEPSAKEESRQKWSKQLDFTFSCIGYAVGLGAVWRFPYLCMRNGGGAFLIPYFTFLFLCGMPLFFLELCIGQFSGLSPLSIWNICPLFKGIGWSMVIMSGIVTIYYNLIITWVLYFLGMSFTSKLPWSSCGNWWNTPLCSIVNDTLRLPSVSSNVTNATATTSCMPPFLNGTDEHDLKRMTAAEEFWQFNVLELSPGIHELGHIRWQLLLCLFAAWLLVFLCLCKGIKSSGKVVYVTATVPYLFLTLLLIRGLMLPGAIDGILFYITPDFQQLLNVSVWAEACLQIFYSLGPAWGGLITMSSYNKFDNNCLRDSVIVCLACCGTSFYAGFVCFSILGHMAYSSCLPISMVVTSGPGLAFSAYPEAITKLPISPLWAILFFLMLLTLGLDSQFGMLETCTSGFIDEFPKYLRNHRTLFTAGVCVFQCVLGIPFVTQGGMYLFQILDWYAAAFSAMVIAFLECVVLSYIYSSEQLYKDVKMMMGKTPSWWWRICWCYITPTIMLAMLVYSCVNMVPPKYGEYVYPQWAIGFGWVVALCSIVPMPAVAVYRIVMAKGSLMQRIKFLLKPTEVWGPNVAALRPAHRTSLLEKGLSCAPLCHQTNNCCSKRPKKLVTSGSSELL